MSRTRALDRRSSKLFAKVWSDDEAVKVCTLSSFADDEKRSSEEGAVGTSLDDISSHGGD